MFLATMVFLTSCAGETTPPAETASERVASPAPTPAPSPTPTPPTRFLAKDLVKELKRAGIPLGVVSVFNVRTDPNDLLGRPGEYISKVNFQDTRIPLDYRDPNEKGGPSADLGGSIETFRNATQGKSRFKYIRAFSRSSSLFAEYQFLLADGLVLLRLSHELTPKQARHYKSVLAQATASP